MDPKPRPNRALYLAALKRMTPQQRLEKTIELSEGARALFKHGLKRRFPDATPEQLHAIFLERLEKCHNRNY